MLQDQYDSDDEDPMARMGPMPEAGAFAAGPIADDGEDAEVGGVGGYRNRDREGDAGGVRGGWECTVRGR